MSEVWSRVRALGRTARFFAITSVMGLVRHWTLTAFSVVAAFGIWFVVQDVENPRVESTVPGIEDAPIRIEFVNVPEGLIVGEAGSVRVVVEVREEDIADLRADDFVATVDASAVRAGERLKLPVEITTNRNDVRVIRAEPEIVDISVVAATSKELPVTVVETGELPSGFRQGLPEVDPPFVTVTGRAELVESVNEVRATVSITGLRDTQSFDTELVPRTSDGTRVTVELSRNRARVTLVVEEASLTRQITVLGGPKGSPARGYSVTNVSINPSTIEVSGPRDLIEGLTTFKVEDVDVTGARTEVIERRELNLPEGVVAAVQGVFVTVSIEAQEGARTLSVPPIFEGLPEGLEVAAGVYFVEVRVSGAEPDLVELTITDVLATVSLQGAEAGLGTYEAQVSVPDGVEIVAIEPIELELVLVLVPATLS